MLVIYGCVTNYLIKNRVKAANIYDLAISERQEFGCSYLGASGSRSLTMLLIKVLARALFWSEGWGGSAWKISLEVVDKT